MSHKICRQCDEDKPVSDYYNRRKGSKYYLDSKCKACSLPLYEKRGCKYNRLSSTEKEHLLNRNLTNAAGARLLGVAVGTFARYRRQLRAATATATATAT